MEMPSINSEKMVLIIQDGGMSHWVWTPEFEMRELETYWSKLEKIESKYLQDLLVGNLFCLEIQTGDYDFDKYLKYFNELKESNKYACIYFSNDKDSYLSPLSENLELKKVFHQGYYNHV